MNTQNTVLTAPRAITIIAGQNVETLEEGYVVLFDTCTGVPEIRVESDLDPECRDECMSASEEIICTPDFYGWMLVQLDGDEGQNTFDLTTRGHAYCYDNTLHIATTCGNAKELIIRWVTETAHVSIEECKAVSYGEPEFVVHTYTYHKDLLELANEYLWEFEPNEYIATIKKRLDSMVFHTACIQMTPDMQIFFYSSPENTDVGSWVNFQGDMMYLDDIANAEAVLAKYIAHVTK